MNSASIRPPAAADLFYPADPGALRLAVEACFQDPRGPGGLPSSPRNGSRLLALVAPHAGYRYSGPVAARAFRTLTGEERPDALLMVGPNHDGSGAPLAVPDATAWETPLGLVPVDAALREDALRAKAGIEKDDEPFRFEHSLEVMLPFLQVLYDEPPPVLPIAWGRLSLASAPALGARLADVIRASGRRILLLASTDFSHYVPDSLARKQDALALERIASVDAGGLIEVVMRHGITMCGAGPTAAILAAVSALGGAGEILDYRTSGDVTGDWSSVVGYGAAAFHERGE